MFLMCARALTQVESINVDSDSDVIPAADALDVGPRGTGGERRLRVPRVTEAQNAGSLSQADARSLQAIQHAAMQVAGMALANVSQDGSQVGRQHSALLCLHFHAASHARPLI